MSRERKRRWGFMQTFIIGRQDNPMITRLRLIQTPLGGIYVHFIYREDLDRDPHDHPWNFASLILRGGYTEELHKNPHTGRAGAEQASYERWSFHKFPLHHAHRIRHVEPGTATLMFVGPKCRTWGFYDATGDWIDYREYLGVNGG